MGLIRTPPNKNQHSPQKQQQQQQQQEQQQQEQHELELEQQIDPFKRKPKLIRSPPPSQQRPNNTLTQIQNSTHTIISSGQSLNYRLSLRYPLWLTSPLCFVKKK
jgi:hypothetical protein